MKKWEGMDEITKSVLFALSALHPGKAIHMTHQFLDGTEGRACGLVPAEWDGGSVSVTGKWWRMPSNK